MVLSLPMLWIVFRLIFNFISVEGLPGPTEDFTKPSRYRKLPEYNCPELYAINVTEIERIQSELKTFKGKYDIVVLNFTVSLDCIFDYEMKYVRHFLVTSKGKTILRYSVEAEYFSLNVFGFKSTILNVNLTPMNANISANTDIPYILPNFTEVSKRLLPNSGFTDACISFRDGDMFNFLTFLFIPKGAIFNRNGLRCQQPNGRQVELQTSALVYVIYAVCFFAAMHVTLLYDIIFDEIKDRKGAGKINHKDETPFSLTRLIPNMWKVCKRDKGVNGTEPPVDALESTSYNVPHCGDIAMFVFSLLIGMGYNLFKLLNVWVRNVIFLNDGSTLDYIINTYASPSDKGNWFFGTVLGISFYAYMFLYLRFAYIFIKSLDCTDVAFTVFRPTHIFTHALEQSKYSRIGRRKKSLSLLSNFAKSYKQLFSYAFWTEIMHVSVLLPQNVSLKYSMKISNSLNNQSDIRCLPLCVSIFFLYIFAFIEGCSYRVLAVVNICVNVSFIILQTICPILKYFFTGYAQIVNKKCNDVTRVVPRYIYAIGMFLFYVIIWCGANLFVFYTVMFICSYFLYLTVVAVPFNPSYGVPFLVIALSLWSYLLMFYEDFQSDYKHLLDVVFEILEEHFVKKIPTTDVSTNDSFDLKTSIKVRQIDAEIFDHLSKKYIPLSRKCAFLFVKLAFTITVIVIAFNALGEFGTGIETLKVSDFFSVILLVMIPGIFRNFTGPRENLRRSQLYFKVFKYLKRLDKKNKLESMVKLDIDESSSDSEEEEDDGVINNEPRDPITDINNA